MTKKVTQARKGLGTNSVGLATELSLVSKLLQKVIPKKISAALMLSPLLKVLKNGASKRKLLPSLSRSKDYETRLKDWGMRYVE